ncbi:MAG: RagB/SusD family nutrient uptake outer membrane protein [Tannerellaceae bacterium]|nr:RagB/SusD family nutrient uptake outer membrane protein [Tannerellaceae bacterium]
MNKIKTYLLLVALLTSCSDFLDLDPLDRYSDAAVWTDTELVTSFVNNIYLGQQYGFHAAMLSSLCDEAMEVWAWESQPVVQSEINPSYLGILGPDFWIVSFRNITWNNLYKNIRACNIFFENIEKYGLEGDEIDRLTGEVYFLRGYFYYWLMSFWGGVPLIDHAYTPTDELLVERNTLEETVQFIVDDLDAAARLLPLTGDKARATKGAALGFKARVLLYAASDLFNSNGSWAPGYSRTELISYTGGDRTARWQAAKTAAKEVMELNIYDLYGGTAMRPVEEAIENYANIFLNHGTEEDIMFSYYDNVNNNEWDSPSPGLFNGPNGYHNWRGNTPLGQMVDSYEMIDGTQFDWNNPVYRANPYENRDPRFYATVLYNGSKWRERPDDIIGSDPEGIVQTGFYENADGSYTAGLDTRQGPVEDWNGTYTGYYMRKFIDPSIDHQYERQKLPWRQMRYAEIILNYAEACLEMGEEDEARTWLNRIRARAGMPGIPASETGQALKERYRNERKIELAYEQHRYFDIRRWMIAPEVIKNARGVDIRYPYGSHIPTYSIIEVQDRSWNNKVYLLPILLDEMNRNELLVQNPGY